MRSAALIAGREFRERTGSRSFWLAALLVPLFYTALLALPVVLVGRHTQSVFKLALVDDAPPGIAESVAEALERESAQSDGPKYLVDVVSQPLERAEPELLRQVSDLSLDGWLYLPPDVLESGRAQYSASNASALAAAEPLQGALDDALRRERSARAGLSSDQAEQIAAGAALERSLIRRAGVRTGPFGIGPLLALLLYMLVTVHGARVLQSVVAEKGSRLPEVLLTSARPSELLLGKILGVSAAAGVQAAMWLAVLALAGAGLEANLFPLSGVLAGLADALPYLPAGIAALFAAYTALGFLLYASLYAVLGASMRNAQDAMPLTFALLLPLLVPVLMISQLSGEPLSRTSTALGLVPFSAPVAMLARLGTAPIPPLEIAASLALLAATTALAIAFAARIYRVGVLASGRRLTLREWLRAGRGRPRAAAR